jgi:uroporphyrinogen-III synthase
MWTSPSPSPPRLLAVPARRVADLPLDVVRQLRAAKRCAATDAVFDVVELARMPLVTERIAAARMSSAADLGFELVAVGAEELASGSPVTARPRPLEGLTVVSTRAAHQTGALAELLEAEGARVVALPAIAMVSPAEPERLDEALRSLETYAAVVFTSENGVLCTFERVRALGLDARAFAGRTVAAIGPGTAGALAREGLRADVMPEEHVGEALAAALVEALPPRSSVAILRATEARDALPRLLREAGHDVDVVPAYTTIRAFDAARFRALDAACGSLAITFTSASTATSVVEALREARAFELLGRCTCVSIGPITTAALAEAGVVVNAEAKPYTLGGLVSALVAHERARHTYTGATSPEDEP